MRKNLLSIWLYSSMTFLSVNAFGQTKTTVADVLNKADGSRCQGSFTVSWTNFVSSDGRNIAQGNIQVPVTDGAFSVNLEAPFSSYSVRYALSPNSCNPPAENWQVPYSTFVLDLQQVRSINPPPPLTYIPPPFISRDGALVGQGICWQSQGYYGPGNCLSDGTMAPWTVNAQTPWDNTLPNDAIIGGVSVPGGMTPATVDHDRFLMTNVYGSYTPNVECCRVQGITGDIHVPNTAITYEACAICGMIFSSTQMVNNVAVSGFVVPTQSGPEGTADLDHNTLHRLTGPCYATSWGHSINTLITVNGVDNFITGITDCDHLTLAFDLGTASGIPWFRRIYQWMENLGCSDDQPGATPAGPGYKHIQCMNEWDFGVYGADSTYVALIFGIGGTKQPTGAHGIVVNGGGPDENGNPVRWNTAFTTFSNCCGAFAEIGTTTAGNSGSQPIIMYARDTMSRVAAAEMNTDEGGNLILDMQTDATNALNPALIIRDTNLLNFAFTGTIGGVRATLSGFQDSAFVPGKAHFADLGSMPPGTMMLCDDCKNVVTDGITAGTQCQGGGSGAQAFAIFASRWECM